MPIEIDDDFSDEQEDVSGLRAQLGKLGKANKAMSEKLARYEVRDLLHEKGYDLVEPDELLSVPEALRSDRASELQEQRRGQQEAMLRKVLQKVGVNPDDTDALEDVVQEVLGARSERTAQAEQVGRARELSRLDSSPVPAVDPRKLQGEDAIAFALQGNKKLV